LIYIYL